MKNKWIRLTAFLCAGAMLFTGCGSSQEARQIEESKEASAEVKAEDIFEQQEEVVSDETLIEDEAVALADSEGALSNLIIPVAAGTKTKENDDMIIDYSNATKGYVMVKFKTKTSKKLKSQVKGPSGVVYTYNLTPKKWASFPLSDGNGKYKVTVYKNVTGTSYATVGSVEFEAKLSNEMLPFLTASQYINYNKNTKCVKKAKTLCEKSKTEMKKVKKIYQFTLKRLSYDKKKAKTVKSGYLPDLDKVYTSKKGICFDYAAMMVAMLRSQGVATKLVIGYAGSAYHAWINVYTEKDGWVTGAIYFDGKHWNLMDPTFADSANSSDAIMDYIGNGDNYVAKYIY